MILFSSKKSIPALFSSLSREYPRDYDFVFVSIAEKSGEKIAEERGIKSNNVPQLIIENFVIPGARTEKLIGKENLSWEKMTSFLTAYSLAMSQIRKQGILKQKNQGGVVHLFDEHSWDDCCPVDAPFYCVIGFNTEEIDSSVFSALAERFKRDQLKFMMASDSKSPLNLKLSNSAKISGPGISVLNRKRGKMSSRMGLEESSLRTFLETILSGSGSWKKVEFE